MSASADPLAGSGSKFWALASDTDSEDKDQFDDQASISTPEFVRTALEAGYSMQDLIQAERNQSTSDTSMNVKILDGVSGGKRRVTGLSRFG